jgi:hypothetical protein
MATGLRSSQDAARYADIIRKVDGLSKSTSEFEQRDTEKLKIKYKRLDNILAFKQLVYSNNIDNSTNSPLYITNLDYDTFIGCSHNINKINMLSNKEKLFAILIDQVAMNENLIRGTDESKTDTLVDYILREIGLAEYPLILKLKPMYELKIRHKTILSVHDFSIEKKDKVVLVEEDKHIRNTTAGSAWGEYQIAGEILAAAYNNYVLHTTESELIAIRVISTRFTFYHAIIPLDYLNSLSIGLPTIDIVVSRYPDSDRGLDYKDHNERKIIIDMLLRIRHKLQS